MKSGGVRSVDMSYFRVQKLSICTYPASDARHGGTRRSPSDPDPGKRFLYRDRAQPAVPCTVKPRGTASLAVGGGDRAANA